MTTTPANNIQTLVYVVMFRTRDDDYKHRYDDETEISVFDTREQAAADVIRLKCHCVVSRLWDDHEGDFLKPDSEDERQYSATGCITVDKLMKAYLDECKKAKTYDETRLISSDYIKRMQGLDSSDIEAAFNHYNDECVKTIWIEEFQINKPTINMGFYK